LLSKAGVPGLYGRVRLDPAQMEDPTSYHLGLQFCASCTPYRNAKLFGALPNRAAKRQRLDGHDNRFTLIITPGGSRKLKDGLMAG
jgi:hypothetical protein